MVLLRELPGAQAQVDFGSCPYRQPDGVLRRVWAITMVLSWSRALYVEFVPRADTATFIRCHLQAFEYFGGVVQACLYDRSKLVVVGVGESGELRWNERFVDFALRLGFEVRLCRGYRPQTKGRVESGIKYLKGNFWPTVRFVDVEDLNRQARVWLDTVANVMAARGRGLWTGYGWNGRYCVPCRAWSGCGPGYGSSDGWVGMATCSGRGRGTGCLGPGSLGRWCRCRRKTGW